MPSLQLILRYFYTLQEIVTYMVAQERAEEQLLLNLCSSDNPLSNFASIKQVSGIKRFYDEAQERCGHFFIFHSNVIAFFHIQYKTLHRRTNEYKMQLKRGTYLTRIRFYKQKRNKMLNERGELQVFLCHCHCQSITITIIILSSILISLCFLLVVTKL